MIDDIERRSVGLNFTAEGAIFTLWAPFAEKIGLLTGDGEELVAGRTEKGYWTIRTDRIKPGDNYKVRINGEKSFPDPASLSQPEGVHGYSRAVDLSSYRWNDEGWRGLAEENIFYELHTGAFSRKAGFEGISDRINYFRELGINTLEIMPVAQFPGSRNWGYDGVFPFAVQHSYGGAVAFMKLVDECHANGIAVILDVVYNHLGPEGNYLNEFGPYFTDEYKTPWGRAINFDGPWCDGVRDFYVENMLMWLRDFHLDGLRLDAVHAIKDFSARHIIRELREKAGELEALTGRRYLLIGEIDLNDTRFISPPEKGGFNLDKQWCDEFHHSLHSLVTGERNGYYADFGELWQLIKSLTSAYVYDGIWSDHRKRIFGSSTEGLPGNKFVVFTQNHDHIGNRAMGDRMGVLVGFEMLKLVAGTMFVSPFNALIFMGEEYNESNPFLYFTSHGDEELARLVSKGRKEEFPDFINSAGFPEPQSEDVFDRSGLSFDITGPRKHIYDFYRELIRLKKNHPVWSNYARTGITASAAGEKVILFTRTLKNNHLTTILNFGEIEIILDLPELQADMLLINSSDKKWGGSDNTTVIDPDGRVRVKPASIVVFSDIP